MDLQYIDRLKEEYQKNLLLCEENIKKFETFIQNFEALKERLQTLPDRLSYDVTVPFGPNAFTMGKIVNTNKITVLLGDDWFAEVSAKQASEIATRRVKECEGKLEVLQKEKEQLENWYSYISKFSAEENVDIHESYNEEEEKLWREQHAKNVTAHHLKMAEERKQSQDKDYKAILEKLEMMELDKNDAECSDNSSQYSESSSRPSLSLSLDSYHSSETYSESEVNEVDERVEKNGNTNSHDSDNGTENSIKHVRWQDKSKVITFKHTRSKSKPYAGNRTQGFQMPNTAEDSSPPVIQSPSDIYKHFFLSSPPKSILKIKSPPATERNQPVFPSNGNGVVSKEPSPELNSKTLPVNIPTFAGDVRERAGVKLSPVEEKSSRPVSHFKSSRKNRRK